MSEPETTNESSQNQPAKAAESYVSRTSRHIAFALIGLFALSFLIIGYNASKGTDNNSWMELFKSGFLLLGGGLTSVIGYYFGSRGTQEAERNTELAREQIELIKREMAEEMAYARKLEDELSPTLEAVGINLPDDTIPDLDEL